MEQITVTVKDIKYDVELREQILYRKEKGYSAVCKSLCVSGCDSTRTKAIDNITEAIKERMSDV